MPVTRSRYQNGSISRVKRAYGPDVWVYRWRETNDSGQRVHRKRIIGTVDRLPKRVDAQRAVITLVAEINDPKPVAKIITIAELWSSFVKDELHSPEVDRSPTTIQLYKDNARLYLLPEWGNTPIDKIKTVAVEKWLGSLMGKPNRHYPDRPVKPLAASTKAKLRNQLCALYSHAIRHDLFDRNPISGASAVPGGRGGGGVRQSSKRQRTPDILSLSEIQGILSRLKFRWLRAAVLVAAVTGLRRSEIRGLRWSALDTQNLWLKVERGIVRRVETKAKTEASRKGVPIPQELADELLAWREKSLYRADSDWMFASEQTGGRSPVWLDVALQRHIRPAAKDAGITGKTIGWHTFRRSLSTLLVANGENVKVTQELMRHSNCSTTLELYAQGDIEAKRAAQGHLSGLFLVS